jgi:acyl-CoA reductase-like NAD-dependent aldehyde dehydrogenase
MYIDGQWVDAASSDYFESDDPFRASPWALIPRGTAADVDRAVRAAHKAFTSGEWPKLTASRRGALLRRLGDLITEHSKNLAEIPLTDEEEAIAIGNDVVYGLAAGVWTQNIRRALTMAEKVQAGTVWINTYRAVSYLLPFGGYKRSGIGREIGQDMIKEYLQVKSVWISTATTVPNPFIQS